jgi:serine/threonine-protein kinase HipA
MLSKLSRSSALWLLKTVVKEEWIGRVECTLAKHLTSWGYEATAPATFAFTDNEGRTISDAHLEQMYKGNYHLLANIDGRNRKFVIRKETPLAESITQKGLANIDEQLCQKTHWTIPLIASRDDILS